MLDLALNPRAYKVYIRLTFSFHKEQCSERRDRARLQHMANTQCAETEGPLEVKISSSDVKTILITMCEEKIPLDVMLILQEENLRRIMQSVHAMQGDPRRALMMKELENLYQKDFDALYETLKQEEDISEDPSNGADYCDPIKHTISKRLFPLLKIMGDFTTLTNAVFEFLHNCHLQDPHFSEPEPLMRIALLYNESLREDMKMDEYKTLANIFTNLKEHALDYSIVWDFLYEWQPSVLKDFMQYEFPVCSVEFMIEIFNQGEGEERGIWFAWCFVSAALNYRMKLEFVHRVLDEVAKKYNFSENEKKFLKYLYKPLHEVNTKDQEGNYLWPDYFENLAYSRFPTVKVKLHEASNASFCNCFHVKLLLFFGHKNLGVDMDDEEIQACVDFFLSHISIYPTEIFKITENRGDTIIKFGLESGLGDPGFLRNFFVLGMLRVYCLRYHFRAKTENGPMPSVGLKRRLEDAELNINPAQCSLHKH